MRKGEINKYAIHDPNTLVKKGKTVIALDKDGETKFDKHGKVIHKGTNYFVDNRIPVRARQDIKLTKRVHKWITYKVADGINEDGTTRFVEHKKKISVPEETGKTYRTIYKGETIRMQKRNIRVVRDPKKLRNSSKRKR